MAWYLENSGTPKNRTSHKVGQKKPNAWGIYDMHGNVWEWCRDWYGKYPNEDVKDPIGAHIGSERVLRGGSYCSLAYDCRSANRLSMEPDWQIFNNGFRVALVPVD